MSKTKYDQRQPLIDTFIERNSKINLSAIREPQDIYTKHILDSIELNNIISLENNEPKNITPCEGSLSTTSKVGFATTAEKKITKTTTLLDLGTGGGFPLLPLAMTNPTIQCTGLDARRKKVDAIQAMIKQLGLTNAHTVWSRAEDHKKQYDYVTARAVGYADKLLPRALPLVKPGGHLILYKQFTSEEDDLIIDLTRRKKLTISRLHHYTLPGDSTKRIIYNIQKQ